VSKPGVFSQVSFTVRRGEILGDRGLMGPGGRTGQRHLREWAPAERVRFGSKAGASDSRSSRCDCHGIATVQ